VHHHYLKGSLFCGRCQQAGITQRMIIQHTVNSRGSEYTYFFCRNKQNGSCPSPHVNVIRIEDAVEDHYATIRFSPEFIADVRTHLAQTLADQESATRLLKQQLTTQLHGLDAKEENLIDLAADGTLPQAKIKQKLREIERERKHLTERLQVTSEDLSDTARLIEACLTLLTNPQELYRRWTTNSGACSTRPSSSSSTSTTTASPDTSCTSRSPGSTPYRKLTRPRTPTSPIQEPAA